MGCTRVGAFTGVASTTSSSSSLLSAATGRRDATGTRAGAAEGLRARSLRGDATPLRASTSGRPLGCAALVSGFASPARAFPAFSLSSFDLSERYSPYISFTPGAAAASSLFGCRPCARRKSVSHTLRSRRVVAIRATRSTSLDPTSPNRAPARETSTFPLRASIAAVSRRASRCDLGDARGFRDFQFVGTSRFKRLLPATAARDWRSATRRSFRRGATSAHERRTSCGEMFRTAVPSAWPAILGRAAALLRDLPRRSQV